MSGGRAGFKQTSDIVAEERGDDEEEQGKGLSGTYLVRFDGQGSWTRLFVGAKPD